MKISPKISVKTILVTKPVILSPLVAKFLNSALGLKHLYTC